MTFGGSYAEPRRLTMRRDGPQPYGLNINTVKTKRRVFVNSVADNSEAQRVGLKKGDCLLQLNGEAVEKLSLDRLESLMSAEILELLVVSDLHGHLSKGALNPFKSEATERCPVVPVFDELFLRQQAIMSSLVNAIESNVEFRNKLQTVDVYKQEPYVGFGLSIHSEPTAPCQSNHKLVYPLIEVEEGSPAQLAGLEYGHRIVAIDGSIINRDLRTLTEISEAIDDSYYQNELTRLTVMDPVMWQEFLDDPKKAAALIIGNARINSGIKNNVLRRDALPRICRLERKESSSFGFSVATIRAEVKHVALVLPKFPAHLNQVSSGDQILEVNGKPVRSQDEFLDSVYSPNSRKVEFLIQPKNSETSQNNEITVDF